MNAAVLSSLPLPRRLSLLVLLTLAVLVAPARADDDPPGRAGRVAEVSGEAWLFDAENKEWVQVARNQTIGEGDRLRTDSRARLSLRIGSTSLWLDDESDLEFVRLDDGRVELHLDKGSLALRLRSREEVNDYVLMTREGRFTAEREGLYRVDQLERGSRALNWEGSLRFDSRSPEAAPVWVQADEQAEFWWAKGPRTERQRLERDEFSDWLLAQRESEGQHLAYRYVSPEMTGAEELDRHGRWQQSSEYGPVWTPTVVAVDWAPYRYGRWGWTRTWGWTWIDEAPWGFAPFHYGRWVQYGGRWCWAPGSYVARPVYAPALVAWGGGPAPSLGIHPGGRPAPPRYGWSPLGPREAYVPGYRHSPAYGQRVNRDHDPVAAGRPGRPGRPEEPSPRPQRNRDVDGAISLPPEQGRGRPMPVPPGGALAQQSLPVVNPMPGRGDQPPRRERPDRAEGRLQPAPGLPQAAVQRPQEPVERVPMSDTRVAPPSPSRGIERREAPQAKPPAAVKPEERAPQQRGRAEGAGRDNNRRELER
jgi:hypothetical protein